jgi:hypothetical protein
MNYWCIPGVDKTPKITIQRINQIVALYFKIRKHELFKDTREDPYKTARQVCAYFAHKYTDWSWYEIGSLCGGVIRATAMHSNKTIKDRIDTDKSFASKIADIESNLKDPRFKNAVGDGNYNSKLDEDTVREIRGKYKYRVYTLSMLAKEYHINETTVSKIIYIYLCTCIRNYYGHETTCI